MLVAEKIICQNCNKELPGDHTGVICKFCGVRLSLGSGGLGIIGTRDSFGIKNAFVSPEGKVIDNFKSWERAGYRNPLDSHRDHNVKEQIKGKIERIKHEKG